MVIDANPFLRIVAALAAVIGFSLPLAAQDAADTMRLDELFAQLRGAEPGQVDRIERQIQDEWSRSGSVALDLLLRRGRDALAAGDAAAALDHFSALVDHAPGFAEGYNGRATAYFLLDLPGPAIDDIREVLLLNPRHFGAMQGLSVMLEEMGRENEALAVLRRIKELHPQAGQLDMAIERLQMRLEGQSL